MTSFKDFVQQQALVDQLPFGIDFNIAPSDEGAPTEENTGFNLPVYNELLSRESWFFECLENLNGSRTGELQLVLRGLAKKLKVACDLKSIKDAIDKLFDPGDLAETESYQDFYDANQADIDRVVQLFRLSQNDKAMSWFRITFFILSRLDAEWTLGKTAALRESTQQKILDFIVLEANKGVMPEALPATEEDEKETPKPLEETGDLSTGK